MNKVILGKLGAAHGIKGFIKLYSFTEYWEDIYTYQSKWIITTKNDEQVELKLSEKQAKGKFDLIRFEGWINRNQAEKYVDASIAVERQELKATEEDEFYWNDLIGCEVINIDDESSFGHLEQIWDQTANIVMQIKGSKGQQTLIPWVSPEFVKDVDLEQKKILVQWQSEE